MKKLMHNIFDVNIIEHFDMNIHILFMNIPYQQA